MRFLSTPSARRATTRDGHPVNPKSRISIHALRKEGDIVAFTIDDLVEISIHALRKEGDRYGGGG